MAVQKQGINIPFGVGLDTKTDPFQVAPGKMLSLENAIFSKSGDSTGGRLQKRNGYLDLVTLDDDPIHITTFSDDLIAIGTSLQLYSSSLGQTVDKGTIQPLELSVNSLVRSAISIIHQDCAVASNGLVCVTYKDNDGSVFYVVMSELTGQTVAPAVRISTTNAIQPSVRILGGYFIVLYIDKTASPYSLKYIAVPISNPSSPLSAVTLSALVNATTPSYDSFVANNSLYYAFNASDGGGAIRIAYLDSTLVIHTTVVKATFSGTFVNVTADVGGSTPVIYINWWKPATGDIYINAYNQALTEIVTPTVIRNEPLTDHLSTSANGGFCNVLIDIEDVYSGSAVETHRIHRVDFRLSTVTTNNVGVILRSVGLASKSVHYSALDTHYVLASYGEPFQPTYFLIDHAGNIVSKLAYSNGGGLYSGTTTPALPLLSLIDDEMHVGYLFKESLVPVNKSEGVGAFYAQLGVNIARFNFIPNEVVTSEIGNNLHITGGYLWMYDGIKPVEHQFHVWPEDVFLTPHTSAGFMDDGDYFYQATYEWTDSQGNLHRSAPSTVTTTSFTGSSGNGSVTIQVGTLRLTAKTGNNPVRIVLYRYSANQPIPYQVTSVTSPILNDTTSDLTATFRDTLNDSSITGNAILYTFGGVVEDIAAPALTSISLYKSRLFGIDAEDRNLLWYSKQVIEATPVEMSDLFTLFVAPTTGTEGSTGPMYAISAMDDKFIIFKKNAIYYITGNGPDNTGANNDFSEPIFITSTVGCDNQNSIVFVPQGLMFQSAKGIWLLGRDMSTQYIGAPVEIYNNDRVKSAVNIPDTNQVRFTLDSGITLMYDYFYNQWGTFTNVPAISSTLYGGKHTYLNEFQQVFQENPGSYVDGARPVLMSFTTAWFNLAGLQGYERAYFFYILGQYLTPHTLSLAIAYDYNSSPTQRVHISPLNFNGTYGSDSIYGGSSPYGGNSNIEQWRIFLQQQKCEAFQITLEESYDASFGVAPGAGFTLSGINLVVGAKSTYPRLRAAQQAG